jgi:CRISPR/Cas system-associated protein Csx1
MSIGVDLKVVEESIDSSYNKAVVADYQGESAIDKKEIAYLILVADKILTLYDEKVHSNIQDLMFE